MKMDMVQVNDYLAAPERVYSERFCRRMILFLVERLDQQIQENRDMRVRPAIFGDPQYPDNSRDR